MKFHLILNPDEEESVTVIAHQKTPLTDAIESLVCTPPAELIGLFGSRSIASSERPEKK